jgi:hypothetical protein
VALSFRRPLALNFCKQGTHCAIRVAVLAADRGAINRLFLLCASCQTGIEKDRFQYSCLSSLCLGRKLVNSKRLAPCSLRGRRTSAQGLPRSFPLLSLWSGHFLHNSFLSEIVTVCGSRHVAYAYCNQVVGRTPVPAWQRPHRAGIDHCQAA